MKLNTYEKEAIVRSIMNDLPQIDYTKRKADAQAAVVKVMSTAARKLYRECPKALRAQHVADLFGTEGSYYSRYLVVGDVDSKTVDAILQIYHDEDAARCKASNDLSAAVRACNTRKQFVDRFPEFEKYAPSEPGKSSNLPALANVVAGLVKLGWPKGETTSEATA